MSDAPIRYAISCPCSFNQEHIVPHSDGGWVSFETYCAAAEQCKAERERADSALGRLVKENAARLTAELDYAALKRELVGVLSAINVLIRETSDTIVRHRKPKP